MFFLDRGPSDPDQAGARDLAAGRRRGVIIGRREGEAGLRRRRREAPERSGSPEALPDFVRRRELRSERKRRRNGPACQAARPKAVPHTRSLRPHFAPERARGGRSVNRRLRIPTIRRAVHTGVPIPKFASLYRSLVCELRNRRTLATY